MRLLFAIPHYFAATPGKPYGALSGRRADRARGLTRTISAIHELFGADQQIASLARPEWTKANHHNADSIDIVVCTLHDQHVLADVPLSKQWYQEVSCDCDPMLLGFECHAALRQRWGSYDYYCYLEDDLVLHDPWFFAKLRRFGEIAGNEALLQPNRFEIPRDALARKVYIDGDLPEPLASRFQDIRQQPSIEVDFLGTAVSCQRVRNPHSGCFFLNAQQAQRWFQSPHFLDRDTGFVGPLESAATLGMMRTFRVYKPAPAAASFLEIEHHGEMWARKIEVIHARMKSADRPIPNTVVQPTPSIHAVSSTPPQQSEVPARPPVQSLWIGKALSTMERLSIASFLANGHPVHLYVYGELEGVPRGTTLLDANTIVPESEIFVQEKGEGRGSVAPFSDMFCFRLLLEKGGWWVDLDMVALRPLEFDRDYVFGYEGPAVIGSAIFRAPRGCSLLERCYEEASRRRGDIEWGEIGPLLLTRVVHELQLSAAAEPRIAFHSIDWRQVPLLVAPGGELSRRSLAIHLIRQIWRLRKQDPDATYPRESLYERLKRLYLSPASSPVSS